MGKVSVKYFITDLKQSTNLRCSHMVVTVLMSQDDYEGLGCESTSVNVISRSLDMVKVWK